MCLFVLIDYLIYVCRSQFGRMRWLRHGFVDLNQDGIEKKDKGTSSNTLQLDATRVTVTSLSPLVQNMQQLHPFFPQSFRTGLQILPDRKVLQLPGFEMVTRNTTQWPDMLKHGKTVNSRLTLA